MRKIVDDVKDMSMCELMDNCMFIKNGEAWYRNFNEEMPFRDLMRKLIKHHVLSEDIYEDIDNMDAEQFDDMMLTDYGALADWESIEFVLAVFYIMGCGMAEVREWLKEYEDNMVHCENCKYFQYKHISDIHDETKTVFKGHICQISNQVVYEEDYCSKGEIDMNIEKEKAEIVEKIKTGKELTEDELEELAFNSDFRGELFSDNLIEVIKRDDTRWSKNMTTVLEFDGELYAIDWRKGLTEQQENAFYKQPYRVRKTERVITIADYERIEE